MTDPGQAGCALCSPHTVLVFQGWSSQGPNRGTGICKQRHGRLEAAGETLVRDSQTLDCESQAVPSPGRCAGGWKVLGSAQVCREKGKQELSSTSRRKHRIVQQLRQEAAG